MSANPREHLLQMPSLVSVPPDGELHPDHRDLETPRLPAEPDWDDVGRRIGNAILAACYGASGELRPRRDGSR